MKTNGKRKIIKDRQMPSSEQINKHQDFGKLQTNYSAVKKVMLKKIIAWTGVVVCAASVAGIVYTNSTKDVPVSHEIKEVTPPAKEACVQPPLPGKEMPYAIYRISARSGGVLNYPNGSSITIPANAFQHSNGAPVSDSIEIRYREFHTPLDIFLSGIPMEYDSAGIERTLESAGMIELRANDNGKELVLNEQSPIQVKMATTSNDPKFNLYELDTVSKNWIYKGKDQIEEPARNKTIAREETKKQIETPVDNTIKPVMADPQRFSFKIRFEKNEFPELAAYDNVMFEVTDNNFKPSYYKINWKKISLQCGETKGSYIVKLSKADTTILVGARPVFDKDNYETALQEFEERHDAASKAVEAKDLKEQKAVAEVNKGLATYNSTKLVQAAFDMAGISVGFRRFSVTRLGYHNIDFPMTPVLGYAYKLVRYTNGQDPAKINPAKTFNDIYLVEKGRNTVFRFSSGEPVRCNPDSKKLMWTVTNSNQIAFFRITDYGKLVNGGENTIEPVVAANQELALQEIRKFSL